ncbi:MAG TPA: S8 family peptidase, partial [candidate division Zixibacteria bacterium]|nr:S8 family peptidase [candidate division Zixibacteria bacterium]
VIVAIIDTGIDRDHPDMAGRIWRNEREIPYNGFDDDHNGFVDDTVGWDFSGDTLAQQSFEDADPSDDVGHGSHVAGIAGAAIDDTIGMAGIVNDCLLMSLKFYPNLRYSTAARAVAYAADNGADVINMSWGGYFPGPILEEALTYASKKGVILCAASGNDGTDKPHYPAFYPNVIAVGATDSRDRVTDFSNYGNYIDVCAPGAAILSLRADSTDIYAETGEPNVHIYNEQYYIASGTSMSTPHVTGVAAYIRALAPGITPAEVRTLIRESADDLTDPYGTGESHPGYDRFSGAGRVNLARALQALPAWGVHLVRPVPNEIVFGTVELYATVVASEG